MQIMWQNISRKILEKKPLLSLSVLFLTSRVILYHFFPFRINFLSMLNQLLDVELLKHRLWESLYYLHVMPPLYDLYVGLILKAFPPKLLPFAFASLHSLLGLGMVLMTYTITKHLTQSNKAGFVAALLFMTYPILIRFEIIPFYTYPLAFLILLNLFVLIKFLETSKKRYALLFLLLPLVILLTRNFFHIIFYFLPIAVVFCVLVWKTRRHLFVPVFIASVLFFAIGLVPNIRNQITYGIFSSSTWQGMQLYSITYFVPKDKIDGLVTAGKVTPLVYLPRFQNSDIYYTYYHETPREGIPALNQIYKSTGEGNFNNWIYAQTAKEYQKNAFVIMQNFPEYYPKRLINSVYIFFSFANYRYFDKTDEWLVWSGGSLHHLYQTAKYFILPALFAIIFFSILWWLGYNLFQAVKEGRLLQNQSVLWLFIFFNLLYVFGIANAVELGENDTARVPIDPVVVIMMVYLLWLNFRNFPHGKLNFKKIP